MKPYLMFFLLLFIPKHEVVLGMKQLCVFRGKSEMLFANIVLDSHKERWALYFSASGVAQPKLLTIWGIESSSIEIVFNDNSNINLDRSKNIWINNVGEGEEGNYTIKYIKDNTNGPQVKLAVFDLTEKNQFQECLGDYPQLPGNHSAPTNENVFVAVANGSISTTIFPGKSEDSIPVAEKSSSEINFAPITVIVSFILIILLIAGIALIIWFCKKRERKHFMDGKLEDGSNASMLLGDENGEGNPHVKLETPVWNCPDLTRQMDDLKKISEAEDESGRDLSHAQSKIPVWRCDELSTQLSDLKHAKGADGTENSYICKVCYANPTKIVFMPCGHHMTCEECSKKLNVCPVCKAVIRAMLETYSG